MFRFIAYAGPLAILLFVLARLTENVPYWDDYGAILGWFAIPGPERFGHLLDFHNEHRLMTARLVFEFIYRVLGRFDFQVCMAVGAVFLLGYAALVGKMMRPIGRAFHGVFLPCLWLIVSFIQYENLCWAMTAASNFQVHFWALLAILIAGRCRSVFRVVPLAILCAIFATLSVGGGMAVWPCLVLVSLLRQRSTCALMYGLAGTLTVALYLWHFPHAGGGGGFDAVNAFLFFVSFAGAWIPNFPLALAAGAFTLGLLGYFAWRFRSLRDVLPLVFSVYLLGNMAAAALFRSGDCRGAMSFRYVLIPISLLACTVTLVVENMRLPDRTLKILCGLFMAGSVLYSLGFLAVGGPLFAARNEVLRRNILCWPAHPEGLRSAQPEIDGRLLEKCRAAGVYDPKCVLRRGEEPPREPLKWLR